MTGSVLDARRNARPRVCSVPRYEFSDGLAAIELAASAGLHLDPWQADILMDSLGIRPDGRWSAFEVGVIVPRQNGKGAIIEARELAGLFLFGERLIMHTAHEFKTSLEAFLRIKSLVDNTDDLRRRVRQIRTSNGEEGIELLDGARLRFVARSSGSGRGFSGDLVILDEAYALQPKELAALLPTMSARPNPQLWYTSTPPEFAAAQLMSLRRRGHAGESARLAYFEYSAPLGADLDDRKLWAATNPALGIRIQEDFVQAEREALPDEEFGRERMGIWPPAADDLWQVIPEIPWTDAGDAEHKAEGGRALGISMTPDRARTFVGSYGKRLDGLHVMQLVEMFPGSGGVVEFIKAARDDQGRPICAVVIGASDPARSLLPDLKEAGIEVLTPGTADVAAECGSIFDRIAGKDAEARTLRHRKQGPLTAAMASTSKRTAGRAWIWNPDNDGAPLFAVTAASYGFRVSPPSTYDPMNNIW